MAFASRTTPELIRAWAVFKLSSFSFLVKNSRTLLGLSRKLVGDGLTTWALKKTFFGHFCGGETAEEVYPLLDKLRAAGIGSILDYAAEADVAAESGHVAAEEAGLDKNVEIFLSCINTAGVGKDGFAAIKLTALAKPELLERITTVLSSVSSLFATLVGVAPEANLADHTLSLQQLKDGLRKLEGGAKMSEESIQKLFAALDVSKAGSVSYIDWLAGMSLTELSATLDEKLIPRLTKEEQTQFVKLSRRLDTVAQAASSKKVRLMVDAEQTYFQKAIDHIVISLQTTYNKEFPVIFNTYQGYLRDSGRRVNFDLVRARKAGFIFAAKTVRGAYMIQERARAEKMGYQDPIQPDIESTHSNYNSLVQTIIKAPQQTELMVASHNEDSVRQAITFQQSLGAGRNQKLYFGQLYGMCDYVSYTLGKHGYGVYKYLPYGPVHEVLPYLIRRAEENSDFLGRAGKERTMLLNEIKRRLLPF